MNVFPVADFDTGSNLYHTVGALVEEIDESASLDAVARCLVYSVASAGRGASGFILTEVLGGHARALSGTDLAGSRAFAVSLMSAAEAAYTAVAEPVEGTMITAARLAGTAAAAASKAGSDSAAVASGSRDAAWAAVADSPRRMDVLSAAGVIDAGAVGFGLFLDVVTLKLDSAPPPHREMATVRQGPAQS
jgi:dihydroxyacetone kinase-like predicted kinase